MAIGLDEDGQKRLLGVGPGGDDQHLREQAAHALLGDLVNRGLRTDHRRLFVIGVSEPVSRAIGDMFGPGALLQRCRSSFRRAILDSLPEQVHGPEEKNPMKLKQVVGDVIQCAFDNWEEGPTTLRHIVPLLASEHQETAVRTISDCLPSLFTVDNLELDPLLRKTLTSTHMITQASAGLRRQICGIASWQEREVAIRWAAASFLEMERGFRRVAGYRHLDHLKQQLGVSL